MLEHPVYKSLNKPLTIAGIERLLFALLVAVSYLIGLLWHFQMLVSIFAFAILWVPAYYITGRNPDLLRTWLPALKFGPHFDAVARARR